MSSKQYSRTVLSTRTPAIETIEDAEPAGDLLALTVVSEAAGNLGIAVSGLLNLINPKLVILGGGFSRLGELLLVPLRDATRDRTLVSSLVAAFVKTSELGPRSIAVGAATMVLDAALADARMFPIPPTLPKAVRS